jgi:hypothetical protein
MLKINIRPIEEKFIIFFILRVKHNKMYASVFIPDIVCIEKK